MSGYGEQASQGTLPTALERLHLGSLLARIERLNRRYGEVLSAPLEVPSAGEVDSAASVISKSGETRRAGVIISRSSRLVIVHYATRESMNTS